MSKNNYDGKVKFKGSLTSSDLIRKRLQYGNWPFWRSSLYNQMRYAFGEPWMKNTMAAYDSCGLEAFPDFADIFVRYQEVGRSRRIVNSQFITLSKICYSDPRPEFLGVDTLTAKVRQGFWDARYGGGDWNEGEWASELNAAFMEGDGLGLGFAQIELRTNEDTGYQQVSVRHSPTIYTIFDRWARHPSRYRFICFVRYSSVEDAAAMFGEDAARDNTRMVWDGDNSQEAPVVRWFEYWDCGGAPKGTKPTRAVILNDFSNEPFLIEENPFGCLPFSYYCHFFAPGMRVPTGRISLQMPTQEALNEIERSFRRNLRQPAIRYVDSERVNMTDMRRVNAGDQNVIVRVTSKAGVTGDPIGSQPAEDLSETTLKAFQIYEDQFIADSGVSDFDRGQSSDDKTLGQSLLVDTRGQNASSWSELQVTKFYERLVRRVFQIAASHDRDPVKIRVELNGASKPYTVNLASDPASSIEKWAAEQADVKINSADLRYQDVQTTRKLRLDQLLAVAPLLSQGPASQWLTVEILKALGEVSPETLLNQQSMAQQPMPGQAMPMGQPQQGQPQQMPMQGPPSALPPPSLMNPANRLNPMAPPPPQPMPPPAQAA